MFLKLGSGVVRVVGVDQSSRVGRGKGRGGKIGGEGAVEIASFDELNCF